VHDGSGKCTSPRTVTTPVVTSIMTSPVGTSASPKSSLSARAFTTGSSAAPPTAPASAGRSSQATVAAAHRAISTASPRDTVTTA